MPTLRQTHDDRMDLTGDCLRGVATARAATGWSVRLLIAVLVWLVAVLGIMSLTAGADDTGLLSRNLDPHESALLLSYPQEMRDNAYTFYVTGVEDYAGMTRDEIVERTGPTHGESYLILGLHRMMVDGSEDEVWDDIRKAREHGSLDAMMLFGHAFENGVAGYRRDLDLAEKNFRNASAPMWKRGAGEGGRAVKSPNHGNKFQLVEFLNRHPDRQLNPDEAEIVEKNAAKLLIGTINMNVNGAKLLDGPKSDQEADSIARHLIGVDSPELRLKIANYFMSGPVLDQFKDSGANAFRLRESVFREFPEEYGSDPSLNAALMTHFLHGNGTAKSMDGVARHIRILAETGDIDAIVDLANLTLNNVGGIERDGRTVIELLTPLMAPESGASKAQRGRAAEMIGNVYDHAINVEFDFPAAYNWYRLAADLGRGKGLDAFIDETHGKMTSQERAEYEQAYQAFRQELGLGRTDR